MAGYKPAEEDTNVSKNQDFDAKVDSDNVEKAEKEAEKADESDSEGADAHTEASLADMKVAELRKIGDSLGVKGKNKAELINNILAE